MDNLAQLLRGRAIRPEDAGYDAARRVYNGNIDRRPAAIVVCADVADVITALTTRASRGSSWRSRGGGHSAPGSAPATTGW